MKKRNAFSLLELLAVVTILGIIAAVVVPRMVVSTQTANDNVNLHNIANLNSAVERYYVENSTFPTALTDLGTEYLPDGVPEVPNQAGKVYTLDANNRVIVGDAS